MPEEWWDVTGAGEISGVRAWTANARSEKAMPGIGPGIGTESLLTRSLGTVPTAQRGSVVVPIRSLSMAWAASMRSKMPALGASIRSVSVYLSGVSILFTIWYIGR